MRHAAELTKAKVDGPGERTEPEPIMDVWPVMTNPTAETGGKDSSGKEFRGRPVKLLYSFLFTIYVASTSINTNHRSTYVHIS